MVLWHLLAHDAVRVLQRLVKGVYLERAGQVGVRQALVRTVLTGERELAICLFELFGGENWIRSWFRKFDSVTRSIYLEL